MHKNLSRLIQTAAFSLLLLPLTAQAQLYKCPVPSGGFVYSNTQCPPAISGYVNNTPNELDSSQMREQQLRMENAALRTQLEAKTQVHTISAPGPITFSPEFEERSLRNRYCGKNHCYDYEPRHQHRWRHHDHW